MNDEVKTFIEKLALLMPEFSSYWASEDSCFNFGNDATVHGLFSDFSTLVINQLENGTLKNSEALFAFIESVVVSGGNPANAACTCLLENILNCIPGSIDPNSFVQYLGPSSAEFCRGWDKFTGVKTCGL